MKISRASIPNKIQIFFTDTQILKQGSYWTKRERPVKIKGKFAAVADCSSNFSVKLAKAELKAAAPTPLQSITIENRTFKNPKIIECVQKYSGPATFILLADGYFFSCKQDVLIDAVIEKGTKNRGVLIGEFIWVKFNGHMRLIKKNSAIYDKILEFNEKKKLPSLSDKDLEPGKFYINKNNQISLYLGKIDINQKIAIASGYNDFLIKNQKAFIKIPWFNEIDDKSILKYLTNSLIFRRNIEIPKTHSYIEKSKLQPKVNVNKIISEIRDTSRENLKKEVSGKNTNSFYGYKHYFPYIVSTESFFANLRLSGDNKFKFFDLDLLLTFS